MAKSFPLYTTRGDWAGLLMDIYVYSSKGEWVGWVAKDSQVFSVTGEYIGWLSKDFRVLRKRTLEAPVPRRTLPAQPPLKMQMPSSAPLPPLMSDLSFDTIDMLDEMPEKFYPVGSDPNAPDMD